MSEEKRQADSLSLVAEEVRGCAKCPLSTTRTNAVPGEGPPDAAVVVIGEGPGRNEDFQGRPFVGAAGKQLDALLKDAGLVRAEVYITNVVKCRPPENRRPTDAEAEACRPYLERQVALIRPTVIVLLGDSALKRFLPEQTLGGAHGRLFTRGGLSLFPTYHPAAMIYNRALEKVSSEDFKALGRVLAGLGPKPRPG
ncbi:MAG: uracil-DNA glycosylase [Thaumarchaeota archaeon]|nr:uracil-DNA glycosylase [Nitrososphaerota archaeon]